MPEPEELIELRGLIGETIPEDGDASDTMVTEAQLRKWYDRSASIELAAVAGWEYKLAHWAGLVNVVDGASARNLSDLSANARTMISYFTKKASPTAGRSRVGKIVRE